MKAHPILKLLFASLVSAAGFVACDTDPGKSDDNFVTDSEACQECQAILVECTSTSRDEQQFILCRDQWQTCQSGRGLGVDKCSNPGDDDACNLCRARNNTCKAADGTDAATCEQEFGICKAYLITRGDVQQQCTESTGVPPEVACGVCQKDLAVCVSDPGQPNAGPVCGNKFAICLGANAIAAEQCAAPTGLQACGLCNDQHAECEASSGKDCEAGFNACSAAITGEFACALNSGTGGTGGDGGADGGGGAGGDGGAGGSGTTCDPCVPSAGPLDVSCNAGPSGTCVADVCAADDFCCTTIWDSQCVDKAFELSASCACTI